MKRIKKLTLKTLLLFSLVGVVVVGGTFALLYANTNVVTNLFDPMVHATGIVETVTYTKDTVTKDIKVNNETSDPAYVRVRVEITPANAATLKVDPGTNWSYDEGDGFYYYLMTLPGNSEGDSLTESLMANATLIEDADFEGEFEISVYSESCYAAEMFITVSDENTAAIKAAFTSIDKDAGKFEDKTNE